MNRIYVFLLLMMSVVAVHAQSADSLSVSTDDSTQNTIKNIADSTTNPVTPDSTIQSLIPENSLKPTPDSIATASTNTTLSSLTKADTSKAATDTTAKSKVKTLRTDISYYFTIQDSASYDTATIRYFTLRNEWYSPTRIQEIDTTLHHFHYTNPIYDQEKMYQSLGNTGLAAKSIFYNPEYSPGFDYGLDAFDMYSINKKTLKFYNTLSPYSNIYYKMAPDKEQILNFTHSQSVYKNVTLGMDVRIISSVGAFLNQKSQDRRVGFTGHYISPDKRYTVAGFYAHNKYDIKENGGIANEEVFENNEEADRLVYDIKLPDANNLTKDATLYLQHSFELSPSKTLSDVASKQKSPFNFGRLAHEVEYYRQGFNYKESFPVDTIALNYYANNFKDTLNTYDTAYYHVIRNTFSWKNSRLYRTPKSLGFDFGITHQLINFQDSVKNFKYNQFILHGRMSKNLYGDLKVGGEVEYVQGDINENDFRLSGIIENSFGKDLFFKANIDQISRDPDYFYRHYHSNHFRWDNNLNKENIVRIGGEIRWNDIVLGGRYYLLTNYTFLDDEALPLQAGRSFSLLQAYFKPSFEFGNLNWDTYVYLQKPSTDQFMRVPFANGKTAISYHNTLFQNALFYQVGIDVMYKDLYYADHYMPALRSFYQQNRKKIGNFFYGDVYASIKIKRTKLILKYRHFNQGLTPYKYYDTPGYPLKDSGLEFALSWRFHD
ncbi:MAG TPA: putative porin [Bacteroidales bacterium]|nr:putative porin [Bacteroidales bacterium]